MFSFAFRPSRRHPRQWHHHPLLPRPRRVSSDPDDTCPPEKKVENDSGCAKRQEGTYLDCRFSDQFDHLNITLLSNPVCTIRRLTVIVWIKVLIEKDYHAGGCQINTHATSFCRQQKDGDRIIFVELIHQGLPDIYSRGSRKDKKPCLAMFEDSLQNIEYLRELDMQMAI